MSNREELDKLIEAAFSDKELSPKEMSILLQKAKELGINEDEFIIELDARMHKLKKKKERKPSSTSSNSPKRFFSKKVIILFIIFSAIVIGLLLVNEFKPNRYKSVKRVKGEFYNAIEKKDFVKAFEYLNELKVLTSEFDHFDYHKELLNVRIPYLLGNNAWEVAFSEIKEVKNYKYDSYDAIQYMQEILFLIADHEIKNGNFNHATQVLDYLFIGIPSDDLNKEGFISFMKTCTNYLISQSKYKEALSLINYYPIPNYEATVKYYEDSHDYYNKDAMIINEALQTLLNKLLINSIHDFPYIELINMYKPIIKRGEFVITKKENRRRLKEGKSAYDKDNWEYFQTTIDYYKFYPSYEYKVNAQNRLKEVGIFK